MFCRDSRREKHASPPQFALDIIKIQYEGDSSMTIVPMRDLKDTVKIERLCREENGPVFVTKNGYGRLVVMDVDCFERIMGQAFEARDVNEGLSDVNSGKVRDGQTVREEDLEEITEHL